MTDSLAKRPVNGKKWPTDRTLTVKETTAVFTIDFVVNLATRTCLVPASRMQVASDVRLLPLGWAMIRLYYWIPAAPNQSNIQDSYRKLLGMFIDCIAPFGIKCFVIFHFELYLQGLRYKVFLYRFFFPL